MTPNGRRTWRSDPHPRGLALDDHFGLVRVPGWGGFLSLFLENKPKSFLFTPLRHPNPLHAYLVVIPDLIRDPVIQS